MQDGNSENEGTGGHAPLFPAPGEPLLRSAVSCRLNAHGQSVWSWRRARPRFEALPYDLATLDPAAGEVEWLAFELEITAFGRPAGYIDLDAARALLGPDGAGRMVARAAAICARRGVGLLVETRLPPETCFMRQQCGPHPPCLRLRDSGASPLAPPARMG